MSGSNRRPHRCERCSTPLLRADSTRLTDETSTQNRDLLEHDWNINPRAGVRQHPKELNAQSRRHALVKADRRNSNFSQQRSLGTDGGLLATLRFKATNSRAEGLLLVCAWGTVRLNPDSTRER